MGQTALHLGHGQQAGAAVGAVAVEPCLSLCLCLSLWCCPVLVHQASSWMIDVSSSSMACGGIIRCCLQQSSSGSGCGSLVVGSIAAVAVVVVTGRGAHPGGRGRIRMVVARITTMVDVICDLGPSGG